LLGCLMPGPFATEWIAYLAKQASGDLEGLLPWLAGAEVFALLERVDLTRATTFADPWNGGALAWPGHGCSCAVSRDTGGALTLWLP